MRVNGYRAFLLSLALLLPAAPSLAQVVNQNFKIIDEVDPDTTAIGNFTGASTSGSGQTICRNVSDTVSLSIVTTHPEFVRLVKNTARLEQGGPGNLPTVRAVATGGQVFNVLLTCDAASIKLNVNNSPSVSAGSFQLQGENCIGLSDLRATYLANTCAADVDNTTIKLSVVGSTIEKFKIKGAGFTTLP